MNVRWIPRVLFLVALGLLIAFAPGPTPSLAGEGGTVPPYPVAPTGGDGYASLELEVGLYALSLIY